LKLNVQMQLNEELRKSCHEQEQRLKDMQLEKIHNQAVQIERMIKEEENQRKASLLLKADQALSLLKLQYDEDMLEVQGLAKVLQQRIFSLQDELVELKKSSIAKIKY
jgi:hypothetical protein